MSAGAIEENADLVYRHDFGGAIVSVRGSIKRITGYSENEIQKMQLGDLLEPEFCAQALQDVMEQMGGGAPVERQIMLRAKSGKRVPMQFVSRILFENGRPVMVEGMGWKSRVRRGGTKAKRNPAEAEAPAGFTAHLRHIHRLNVRTYGSLPEVFEEFLKSGCEIFRLPSGLIHRTPADGNDTVASWNLPPGFTLDVSALVNAADIGCYLGAPILVDGVLYGRLSFFAYSGPPRRFSSEEREMVELMGRGLGRVILEHQIRAQSDLSARLEKDRTSVLDMLVANRPLREIMLHLLKMIERQSAGARGAVILFDPDGSTHVFAPNLDASYRRLAGKIDPSSLAFRHSPLFTSVRSEPDLASVLPEEIHPGLLQEIGLGAAISAPIVSESNRPFGLILLHYSKGTQPRAEDRSLLTMASRAAALAIEQQKLAKQLALQLQSDPMTGLLNREHLTEMLEEALVTEAERGGIAAVLFLDLDRFKQVNDALGHAVGDQVLKKVAARLQGMLGPRDVAARIAADEFAVVLAGLASISEALRKPAEFLDAMRKPFQVDDHEVFATASIGLSTFPLDGDNAGALLRKAERAMQAAKKQGKNDWRHSGQEQTVASAQSLEMETALRHAIENSELRLQYQPIVAMNEELAGLEALLVWSHPKLGRISPAVFIPLAEEAGLIQQIGNWVLHEVCRQNAHWQRLGYAPVRVAANISVLQFSRPEFFDAVRAAIDESRLNPEWLELELTEGVIIQEFAESVQSIRRLRALGVRISIDDFGTGYSSLNYLHQLPLDTLKIDRSFVRNLTEDGGALPVVQTIISLAHNLRLQVIAEGVETIAQLEILRRAGCDKIQGHLYGTAVPSADIEMILRQPRRFLSPRVH